MGCGNTETRDVQRMPEVKDIIDGNNQQPATYSQNQQAYDNQPQGGQNYSNQPQTNQAYEN